MSNDSWCTPDYMYNPLNEEFKFEFDLCASMENKKCKNWSTNIARSVADHDTDPFNNFWINPPYSRGNINSCMDSVAVLNLSGKTVVSLTRFDPSSDWFQCYVDGTAAEVRMLDKRMKFKGASSSYPFPCCVAIYRGYIPKSTNYYIWGVS